MASLLNMSGGSLLNKGSLLPSGYRQVEYIENTSNAYIDTGIMLNQNTEVEVKCKLTNAVTGYYWPTIFGFNENDSERCFLLQYDEYKTRKLTFKIGKLQIHTINNDALVHTIRANRTVVNIDGVDYNIGTSNVTLTPQTACMFATKTPSGAMVAGDATNMKGRIYYCSVKEFGLPIRNYISCINPQNVVGLYDTVEGQFYSSPNGVAFVAGPVIS